MEVSDLKRGMTFVDPDSNVSVRNRDTWRWTNTEVVITNIRRYGDNPEDTVVYYKDNGGNKWKSDAEWFLDRYGEFVKEAIAPTTPAHPDMSDPNPAAIPNACPGCGSIIDRPMYYSSMGDDGKKEYYCPKCGAEFEISTAPDEMFLNEGPFVSEGNFDRLDRVISILKGF